MPPVLGALLSAGTALVAARLATRLFGGRAGVAAAVLVSCEPGTFLRSLDALSDTPFTFALMLFASTLAGYAGGDGTSPARAGFWLALATLVRPISYYLLPLAALFVLVVARRRGALVSCGVRGRGRLSFAGPDLGRGLGGPEPRPRQRVHPFADRGQ